MKKSVFVLFCQKNLTKPKIYKTLPPVLTKVKQHKTLNYKGFENMIDAEIFMHPKSLEYLKQFQKYQQKGINLERFQKQKQEQANQQTAAQNKQKRQIKKLIDEMHEQIKESKKKKEKEKKKQQKSKQKQFKEQLPIVWLLAAFENKDLLSSHFITSAKTMNQYRQKLQNCQLLTSKVHITQQKIAQSLQQILQQKAATKKTKKSRKYLDFQKFELKNQPELNKNIQQIFQHMLLIQGRNSKDHNNFVITRTQYPVTSEQQCVLMISAEKHEKTKRYGLAYVTKKIDGTLLITGQFPCDIVHANQVWFMSLLFGLSECYGNKIGKLKVMCDDESLIKLMQGKIQVSDPRISSKFLLAKLLASKFNNIEFQLINSQMNQQARDMARLASRNIII